MKLINRKFVGSIVVALVVFCTSTFAEQQFDEGLLKNLKSREIGPATMGGRIADIAVVESNPSTFYIATASGGLLKTQNGGMTWDNIFDRQSTVSIGDVAINRDDSNVIWVGTGEPNNRQSSSWGDGVYKSTDGGKTWKHMGLKDSRHIGRIVISSNDTDVVYVAALGHLWGANRERGVYKTTDGGLTWVNVLFVNEDTGIADLAMDPSNEKVLYAAAYQRRRSGWGFNGGGPHSGIYKTVDGGRTWVKLTNGLPEGDTGRIGLDIYRKNSNVVYATIENKDGGVFRSEDKGESWTRMNSLNPRPMYFSQIRVDPTDDKRIYVCGNPIFVSDDGGKTFRDDGSRGVHADHHALWINPRDPNHLINGNDGGIWVTYDRGKTWDHLNNVAIGQFYNVAVDMQKPYYVYGGTQDNGTWGGASATRRQIGIANDEWFQVIGGDGMYVAIDPLDPNTVYANHQDGRIRRYNPKTGERKGIQPQPRTGEPPLRWNWTSPILISPHDPKTVYIGANKLFRSTDRAHSWTAISPDLTTQTDRDTFTLMGVAAKDITLAKNDGVSSFGNITSISESPKKAGLIYVGTDDGNLQVTQDGGRTWTHVSDRIPDVPKMTYVSRVHASAFDEGTVYASFDGHRNDDISPYVYVSNNYGQTWRSMRSNLPDGSVYVIKEDPRNPTLLYVGTEFGLFVSLNRGGEWVRWRNVPTVAVYDVVVHPRDNDLILGTHGRSILVVDDVSPLQQLTETILSADSNLFDVRPATQFFPNQNKEYLGARYYRAPNPEFGANINYYLKSNTSQDVDLTITDATGKVVRELKGPGQAGIHRIVWDLRTAPPPVGDEPPFDYIGAPNPTIVGPFVLPGEFRVKLSVGGREQIKMLRVEADPLSQISENDRKILHETLVRLTDAQVTVNLAVTAVNDLRAQIIQVQETLKGHANILASVKNAVESTAKQVGDLRTRLMGEDPLRTPTPGFGRAPTLRGRINMLKDEVIRSESLPTTIQSARLEEYLTELNALVGQVNGLISTTVPNLYKQLNENNIRPSPGGPIKPIGRSR